MFGAGMILAGGCAVGAGISGASVFTVTAFVTLGAMWAAASITDWLVDRRAEAVVPPVPVAGDGEPSASYARP